MYVDCNNPTKHLQISRIGILSFILIASLFDASSQTTTIVDTSNRNSAVIIAGKEYKRSGYHNLWWGNHYRKEWSTPVRVKSIMLDTAFGGLTPIKKGGGRQTRTLRLQNKNGQQYVLRSINKTYTKALPALFAGTFVESVANDQVSIAHPYSAVTVPMLAEAAKVYHTNPQIVFVPHQKTLGEYDNEFGDQLYLFEERAAGFEGDAENFGNAEDVDGTDKMMKEIYKDNDHRVDQESFVRARLFDMFLSDWGRHEDQWRWAKFDEGNYKIYRPIPRDRDQAYTKFDGLIVKLGKNAAHLVYLQNVDYTIKNIRGFNFPARHMDRQLANEPSLATWQRIARELQPLLTDSLIDESVKKLPPEVYGISGPKLAAKLKSRRDKLVDFATDYYLILAREVDVVGTDKEESFEVTGINDNEIRVSIYDLDSNGNKKPQPFYSRTFTANETKEVRLYGWNGNDQFIVNGTTGNRITLRLIGGPKKDSYTIDPNFAGKVKVYDDKGNEFNTIEKTKLHLSSDSSIHVFKYDAYKDNFSRMLAGVGYSNEDRLFARLGYRIQKQHWRKEPFASQVDFGVKYSLTQHAFSFDYSAIYNQFIGQWDLGVLAGYDFIRDQHFPGIGNNTIISNKDRDYYRYRNREANAAINLYRQLGHSKVSFGIFYQRVEVLPNAGRFISDDYAKTNKYVFDADDFVGARTQYDYSTVNDKLFPSKGVHFSTGIELNKNLSDKDSLVARFSGMFGFYIPIAHSLTLAIKTAAATLSGEPEFFQLNKLGGGSTLRGFLRYRFYGNTAFYNQNELQWNFNIRSYLFNGKMGILALLDDGRVWQSRETSDKWHVGIGGGFMLAPFNKISITPTYTQSVEGGRINVRVGRLF